MTDDAGKHDDRFLPERSGAVRPVGILSGNGFAGAHPDDPDVSAEGYRLDPIFGLATGDRPQLRPKAEEGLGRLHVERLGRHEMTTFVDHDHQNDAYQHDGSGHRGLRSSALIETTLPADVRYPVYRVGCGLPSRRVGGEGVPEPFERPVWYGIEAV